jgi:hypothetical protein
MAIDRPFDEPLMLAERVALAGVFDEMQASDAQAVGDRWFVRDRPSLGEQIAIFGGAAKDSPARDFISLGCLLSNIESPSRGSGRHRS